VLILLEQYTSDFTAEGADIQLYYKRPPSPPPQQKYEGRAQHVWVSITAPMESRSNVDGVREDVHI